MKNINAFLLKLIWFKIVNYYLILIDELLVRMKKLIVLGGGGDPCIDIEKTYA